MKKKFISVLTALMVLSMSTTVFGANSPTTGDTTPVDTEKVEVAADAATAVTEVTGAASEKATAAEVKDAANKVATVVEDGYKGTVAAVIKLTAAGEADENGNYNITVTVPSIKAGADVFVLHIHDDGTFEKLAATVAADGKVSFSVKNFSTFAIVENVKVAAGETYQPGTYDKYLTSSASNAGAADTTVTSPKTAEAANVMPVIAVICLAGIVVCTRKVKFN